MRVVPIQPSEAERGGGALGKRLALRPRRPMPRGSGGAARARGRSGDGTRVGALREMLKVTTWSLFYDPGVLWRIAFVEHRLAEVERRKEEQGLSERDSGAYGWSGDVVMALYAASVRMEPEAASSQSRTTAAVQDCSPEPRGSPVNGSKYSAKPPWAT